MKTLMGTKSTLNTTTKFKKVSRKQYLNCLLINQGKIKSNKFRCFSCHSLLGRQHYYSARMWGLKSSMEFRDGRIKNWTKNCLHWWTDFFCVRQFTILPLWWGYRVARKKCHLFPDAKLNICKYLSWFGWKENNYCYVTIF